MRRHLALSAAALAAAAASFAIAAGAAVAAGPAKTAKTPKTSSSTVAASRPAKAKPLAAGQPAKGSAQLYLRHAYFVHGGAVTVPGRAVEFDGVVRPFVPGQWVNVTASVGRRVVKTDRLRVRRSRSGRSGRFTEDVSSPIAGLLTVRVTHARTAQMLGFLAERRVAELAEHTGFGSSGRLVVLIQQRLAALHFYLPQTGTYDQQTGLAVDAYHRLLRRGTSQSLDAATVTDLLNGVGTFTVRHPRDGKHVEGNLSDQLLALIYGSRVYRIYPISSGKPSTPTVIGHFQVYLRDPGYLPDGMYYSSFFTGGYAIHGYSPAPDYPASHGCMRLPIIDAISVYDWLNYGDVVDVYR